MIFHSDQFFNLSGVSFRDLFSGVENVWEVLPRLHEYLEEQFRSGKIKSNYGNEGNVFIGEGTRIETEAKIIGPAIIGKNSLIAHSAFLRGGCLVGDDVTIGHATEIKHSIIMNNTAAAHLNYIGDSIVGNRVNVSGGAIFANLRLDHANVTVKTEEGKIDTGLGKFGAIVGDGGNIGVNCVLNPGAILGKNIVIYPLKEIRGIHKKGEIIK